MDNCSMFTRYFALSTTYRSKSIGAQLRLLIVLMNRQSNQFNKLNINAFIIHDVPCIPTSIIITIGSRNHLIYL
ncbi:unnamed protein product [Rotaria sordida]|uniref:Uncharacterized protein n=1 Tax=Rotaria sordida TaxID=392033 RepID=A0A819W9L7_9BILA|nr:unnamed protein product [Rotaria sordida]CAF1514263.1 unnamed protein product [Rotaria sordida]CAF4078271.1 unnamed protein product [Rotaria sordida]CAF4123226.1 unnamed protein product [Rotaria sordida]